MGKQGERLYLSQDEHLEMQGKVSDRAPREYLPFDHCALSLVPFETPCYLDGIVFDLAAIFPYVIKHKKSPVSGESVTTKDIVRLKMKKSSLGKWVCPILNKEFTSASHIVAIKTTGNVFSFEAVKELNLKCKNLEDLISGESFSRADIITIQDRNNEALCAKREISSFQHLATVRAEAALARRQSSSLNLDGNNAATEQILHELKKKEEAGGKLKRYCIGAFEKDASVVSGADQGGDVTAFLKLRPSPRVSDLPGQDSDTTGKTAQSLTSTGIDISTKGAVRHANANDFRKARYKGMKLRGKKAYVQLQTVVGNLNVELHCDRAPQTCWNFLELCKRGYYDGTSFHRVVPGFCAQGGDPTGSGAGGESAFADKDGHCRCGFNEFPDEFDDRLVHDSRGTLSMANSGPNTNKSQFFFALKPCPHLNRKHTLFGRLVGGHSALDRLEEHGQMLVEEAKIHGKARSEPIKIIAAVIVKDDSVSEVDTSLLAEIQARLVTRKEKGKPLSPSMAPKASSGVGGGVGKYLGLRGGRPAAASSSPSASNGPPPKKKVKRNLDDW
jgi:peptidyl-prolyl cis-trans isomerase-like protein 2